ncbi:hypothetical protein DW172_03930 [Agathobacter rectalis]|jgi:Zn finger protein HypA/HybF involved in hydrogenase expression|uniref:Uncharacterized protein n=1 Tax=Agathobacter rectalis TaxID=39491 RepID=A0A414ZRI0_9FIRM|nr:hypothetical protein [Agathobacter rectalis]RHI25837.1 hypothetical protein DW172_03930 [Agathobacter rectalis]
MIINKDMLECKQCGKIYFFESSKPYSKFCLKCGGRLNFIDNVDCDTELAEQRKNQPKYNPMEDPNFPLSKPKVECPYCHSTNTSKIGTVSRMTSTAMFGLASKKIGKQWHCNSCNSDF